MIDASLKSFVDQMEVWKHYFKSRIRIALAVQEEGEWTVWYSYTAFLPEIPESVEVFNLETQSIRAFRDILVFDGENSILAAIAEIRDGPKVLKFETWSASLAPSSSQLSFEYESMHPDRFSGPRRLPALTASWHNLRYAMMSDAKRKEIDQELQMHWEPYDGLADLALALNIPVGFDELNKRRFSEFVLISPVDLLFDVSKEPHSALKGGELSLVLKGHPALSSDQLKLGVKAFRSKDVPDRFTISNRELRRDADGYLRAKLKLRSSDVPLVEVFVSTEDGLLGKWFIRDFGSSFNDRMLVHRALDTREHFKPSFFDRPEQFEDRVLLVLTLLGLTALKYGKIQTDAPDILAFSTARHVYVIECTTGDINSRGKLQRLNDRTRQIQDKLTNTSNPPVGIIPVIFTSLAKEDTAMHWDTAATFRIALVAREDIISLLNNLDGQVQPEQLYNATLALIPGKKSDSKA